MTVAERVEDVVQEALPEVICDDCIADALKIVRQHVNIKTRFLSEPGKAYRREKACCPFCNTGREKLVLIPANVVRFPRR